DVEEPADADDAAEVAGRDPAELPTVPAQVGGPFETHLAQPDAVQHAEHDGLETGDLVVEVVVLTRLGGHDAPHHRAATRIEGGAAPGEGTADHLDAELLAGSQIECAVDVVEPSDVEVRRPPHARLENGLPGVGGGAGEDRHLRVVLERVDFTAVDVT